MDKPSQAQGTDMLPEATKAKDADEDAGSARSGRGAGPAVRGLGVEERLEVVHAVQPLPGEVRLVAAKVSVRRGLGVDGPL